MKLGIMNSEYDTSISEEQLASLNAEDTAWFKDEIGLSREDLYRILARAKEIVQPNDFLLTLTYDTDGAWYINFERRDTDGGHWEIYVHRKDQTITRQQATSEKEGV